MASRTGKPDPTGGEFDGTGQPLDGGTGQPVDPAAALVDSGNGAGTGDGNGGDSGGTRRRNTGPRGPNKAKTSGPVSVSGIEALLFSAHTMMAAAFQSPEIALTKSESETLAKAVADVAALYPTTIDPKLMAWSNLAMVVGMVYGPRVYMLSAKGKKSRTAKGGDVSQNVANFTDFTRP